MKMKKVLAMAAACAMMIGMTACSGASSGGGAEGTGLSGSVATGGSTSVEKVIGALSEAFMEADGQVTVTYDPTGSGAGVTGAADGTLDIGLSSRSLKDSELEQGLKETVFALDGIAIVVNQENTVEDLTMEQIAQLATGEITNWSEVGGPDMPVVLVGREAGSGTRDGFESVVGVEDACAYEQELTSTGAVKAAVAANPNAFGYISLASVDEDTKVVTVDGIVPSEETVKDGSYKIQRPFVFVTKADKELKPEAQAFFDFALSEDAADLIRAAGAVPVV